MKPDRFILNDIPESAFGEHNFYFWVRCVVDALNLIGPETDGHLEHMIRVVLDYYGGMDVSTDTIKQLPHEIMRLRGVGFWRDDSPIGLKYRCLYNLAQSQEENLADLYNWQYGVDSSFDLINLGNDKEKEQTLNSLIRENASKYGVDLHEFDGRKEQGLENVELLLTQAESILDLAVLLLKHAEDE